MMRTVFLLLVRTTVSWSGCIKRGTCTLEDEDYDENTHRYNRINYNLGELYQTVHNRKYMEEHPKLLMTSTRGKTGTCMGGRWGARL